MQCKNCLYPLWRLRARQCPECGTPFSPSDFEFVPYSVRFLCPHCDQEYYGDGERGHLVPVEFDCVKCARHVHMNEMVVEPAAGVEERQTQAKKFPWLERKALRFWKAWSRTVGMALIAPGELMAILPVGAPLGAAFGFMLRTQAMIWIVAAVPLWGIVGFQMVTVARGRGGTMVGPMVGGLLIMFGVGLALTLGAGVVFALVAHGVLAMTGRRAAGLGRTMQAMAYSSGANVLTAIPCVGLCFGWIWWVVSATIALKEAQRVQAWRAVVAVVAPVVLALLLVAGGYAWLIYWSMNTARTAAATATMRAGAMAGPSGQVGTIARGLLAYSTDNGSWPGHAAELIIGQHVTAEDFVGLNAGWSVTATGNVDVGRVTLDDFVMQAVPDQEATATAAAGAIPPGDAAYRVGDMVICLTPRDGVQLPQEIWMVIAWPDPAIAGNTDPYTCHVADASGNTIVILRNQFDADLAAQNRLRAKHGMRPLPHPRDVKALPRAAEGER